MPPLSRWRVLGPTALLLATAIVIPSPVQAQAEVPEPDPEDANPIRFDRDPADYLEGEPVTISFHAGIDPFIYEVRVRCLTCPDKGTTFKAPANPETVFPQDFGDDAKKQRQPRWNDTWEVALATGGQVAHTRNFHVWVLDAYKFPRDEPYPTGTLNFVATGFDPNDLVQFTIRHRRADGFFENVAVADSPTTREGRASFFWMIDKSETAKFSCPPRPAGYCQIYEVVVQGPGKDTERVRFRMVPAHFRWLVAQGDGALGVPAVLQRSTNVTVDVDLRYPNNHAVTPFHLTTTRNPEGGLKLHVEKYVGDDAYESPVVVANLSARYVEGYTWRANWSIPRDTEPRVDHRYRFAIVEQKDRYGNVVDYGPVNNFTVTTALLAPRFHDVPDAVERLDEAKVVLALRYHDNRSLEPGDNATALRACFLPDNPGVASCSTGAFAATPAYWKDGLWNFTYRFPRDYPDLSGHRFLFEGSPVYHEDRWGNRFRDAMSEVFAVVPAKPRVNLTTAVAGEARNATAGWERGDRVAITARITYPDGSPFNRTVNWNQSDVMTVHVTKIARGGTLAGDLVLNVTNTDGVGPDWHGAYTVPKDAAIAPAGPWELLFRVRDNLSQPNENTTRFVRNVHPTSIKIIPTKEPPPKVPIGTTIQYRFRLVYADGSSAKANDVGTTMTVVVVRTTGRFAGAAVSATLVPAYDPERDDWGVEWDVPRALFLGTFAFKPRGFDRHDNRVDPKAQSRAFATFTDSTTRGVLTEPPTTVERGQSVVVVFDGRDGDVSFAGFPGTFPAIELQRYDGAAWVTERRNVRVPGEGDGDHVGRFNTTIATSLGLYRFALRGRDFSFNVINGTTEWFTIVPTNVTRSLLVPPPERVGKGQFIEWTLEREAGDTVTEAKVFYEGRPLDAAVNLVGGLGGGGVSPPIYSAAADRFNFSWRVPYALDTGTYTFATRGKDAYGNGIVVDVPPVKAEPSVLSGQVLGNPERLQKRGTPVRMLFAVTYPNGDFFQSQGRPTVVVVNSTGVVGEANVAASGLVYEARWTPPFDAGLDEYWFDVSGQDRTGNVFPALRSGTFRLAPGTQTTRNFEKQPPLTVNRLTDLRLQMAQRPEDVFVAFTLGYVSDASQITQALIERREATPVASLEHAVSGGKYVVRWSPDRDEKAGIYVVEFSGLDSYGNEFKGRSEPFTVKETNIKPVIDPLPDGEFGPAKTVVWTFRLSWALANPPQMDNLGMQPAGTILYRAPGGSREDRPLAQRPDVSFDPEIGKWVAEWAAPEYLPDGEYVLLVQGQDDAGNPFLADRASPQKIETPAVSSLFRLANIPAPGPLAAIVALAIAVAIAARDRARREA